MASRNLRSPCVVQGNYFRRESTSSYRSHSNTSLLTTSLLCCMLAHSHKAARNPGIRVANGTGMDSRTGRPCYSLSVCRLRPAVLRPALSRASPLAPSTSHSGWLDVECRPWTGVLRTILPWSAGDLVQSCVQTKRTDNKTTVVRVVLVPQASGRENVGVSQRMPANGAG